MIITTPKSLSNDQLLDLLRRRYPYYNLSVSGLGVEKSVLVRKSPWVAAQVTVRDREIMIDGSFGNLLLSGLMTLITLGHLTTFPGWMNMEQQLARFLSAVFSK